MFPRSPLRAALLALLLLAPATQAQSPTPAHRDELNAAFEAAQKVARTGPAQVDLIDQARLKLPEGYIWVGRPEAERLMKAMGNSMDERFIGLVFPGVAEDWMVVAEFEKAGYVKDDDAKNWDVDALLDSLKEGTEAANEGRRGRGFPELEVVGWAEKPRYDAATHRLVWSMAARRKGAAGDGSQSVNYNSYALGREGYVTLNLITDLRKIGEYKPHAETLLAALEYQPGKTYADFQPGTDKVAEYGIAALIAGVAAKKLGLFATLGLFLAKFWKIIAVAVAVGAGGIWKRLRGGKDGEGAG